MPPKRNAVQNATIENVNNNNLQTDLNLSPVNLPSNFASNSMLDDLQNSNPDGVNLESSELNSVSNSELLTMLTKMVLSQQKQMEIYQK